MQGMNKYMASLMANSNIEFAVVIIVVIISIIIIPAPKGGI